MGLDTSQFEALAKRVGSNVKARKVETAMGAGMNRLGASLLGNVKNTTPVDTGTLRRGWNKSSMQYAGNQFSFELFNNVEYASFVENGHRTRNKKGWVEGRFFLKGVEIEYKRQEKSYWQPIFDKALRGVIDD
ncbi:HK97 gp10 family phage protein [Apilactobacillus xinyiensis]|uniref:HK97 gp10 family phage protein n=1 Tax=Apilactobacillus xinyiensis TaxID=2841032 RepID=UPI00200F4548|nr:HK97 gp10 family phage protein [Apilactobacillus xinyiensis]MCL0330609.1 HK97 gp10 family phage protein [Apilactobacillus xinyiensis]